MWSTPRGEPPTALGMIVQAGAFGEHAFTTAAAELASLAVNDWHLEAALAAGAGARIRLGMTRYAHQPTLAWPW